MLHVVQNSSHELSIPDSRAFSNRESVNNIVSILDAHYILFEIAITAN